jgi:ABC-type lipoprotein export system ATPase subunit
MNKNLVEFKKINKSFKHKNGLIKIFKNINFSIKRGELVALIGPSGSGKSSLIHLLALLDKPTSGEIILNGLNSKNFNSEDIDRLRRKKISVIFQNNNLLSDFTAVENVLMPLIIRNENYKTSLEKAKKALKVVKLSNRLNHFPNELSGGEQQRVAIARALISETELVLADEPTGNLDFKTSQEVFSYFIKLKKLNKTVLFATHNREIANKADYKFSIFDGIIKRMNG